jgi:hypothetical protein
MKNSIIKINFAAPLLVAGLVLLSIRTDAVVVGDGLLANISTRLQIQTGETVAIAGFIVDSPQPVLVRALGPTLANFGVTGVLADPTIELRNSAGTLIASNDNWKDTEQAAIAATGFAPPNDKEPAILRNLAAGAYTAIVRGKNNTSGVGLVEAYGRVDPSFLVSAISNISTRGLVGTGSNVMIGGFIGDDSVGIIVRALGPTLTQFGISNALADPTLELHDANGNLLASNDNWQDSPDKTVIQQTGHAPPNASEAAISYFINAGVTSTAIVRGKNGTTGVALVEVYARFL